MSPTVFHVYTGLFVLLFCSITIDWSIFYSKFLPVPSESVKNYNLFDWTEPGELFAKRETETEISKMSRIETDEHRENLKIQCTPLRGGTKTLRKFRVSSYPSFGRASITRQSGRLFFFIYRFLSATNGSPTTTVTTNRFLRRVLKLKKTIPSQLVSDQ